MRTAWTRLPSGHRPAGGAGITLVELLIAMSIMTVVTTMILMGWFSLSRSYSLSVSSSDARDSGRQAVARMQREVRDAQKPPADYPLVGTSTDPADAIVYVAHPFTIAISTTFNQVGNSVATWQTPSPSPSPSASLSAPRLVVYRLFADDELWRFRDVNGNGVIDMSQSGPFGMTDSNPSDFNSAAEQYGEGATLLLKNVVNTTSEPLSEPLFTYNYYNGSGGLRSDSTVLGVLRYDIIAVQIHVLVDLDPTHPPVYADLRSTAELRNAR